MEQKINSIQNEDRGIIWVMSKSIKKQLLLGNILTITVVLTVICFVLFFSIRNFLYIQYERSFNDKYNLLESLIEFSEEGEIITEWVEQGKDHPYGFDRDLEGFSLWKIDGQEITHSGIPIEFISNRVDKTINTEYNGQQLKIKSSVVVPVSVLDEIQVSNPKPKAFISYAQINTVAPYLSRLKFILVVSWLACVTFSSLILLWNTRKSLKPFNELKTKIEALKANSLNEIKLSTNTTEITPVTDSINSLLVRIQAGLVREKQLTSNIAHELKNPLAGLLNLWDVTLKRERTAKEYIQSGERSLEATEQMVKLVRNLLSLSKLESGEASLSIENVNLSELLLLSWKSFENAAKLRGIVVDCQIASDCYLETDPVMFNIILSNIYDNLVCYADRNTRAIITLSQNCDIRIGNQVQNIDEEISNKIFDPLWRQSESRSEIGVHAGIGMALAHKVSIILGLKIKASVSGTRDWFEINITQ